MRRYFAYGSNMAARVMQERCPSHVLVGRATLPDHRLVFDRRSVRTGTGVVDAVPHAGSTVWGIVYDLDDDGFAVLDRKEGRGWAYDRVTVRVVIEGDEEASPAETYRVRVPERAPVAPSAEYLRGLLAAARARGLPVSYLDEVARAARAS